MRVIITGSRDWDGIYAEQRIQTILNVLLALADVLGQKLTIVHGDGRGADQAVDRWARRRDQDGVTIDTFPAEWGVYGKSAGPVRNQAMVDRGADMCIGFVRGKSPGTQLTLSLARNAGIPTYTIYWEEE